jgi:hypothetical protein
VKVSPLFWTVKKENLKLEIQTPGRAVSVVIRRRGWIIGIGGSDVAGDQIDQVSLMVHQFVKGYPRNRASSSPAVNQISRARSMAQFGFIPTQGMRRWITSCKKSWFSGWAAASCGLLAKAVRQPTPWWRANDSLKLSSAMPEISSQITATDFGFPFDRFPLWGWIFLGIAIVYAIDAVLARIDRRKYEKTSKKRP